jgi:outer membrane protein assembly factor BamB
VDTQVVPKKRRWLGLASFLVIAGALRLLLPSPADRPELLWLFSASHKLAEMAIDDRGVVYTGSSDGSVYAVYPDGEMASECELGAPVRSGVLLSPDHLLYTHDNAGWLHCLALGGEALWRRNLGDAHVRVKIAPAAGRVYVSTFSSGVIALSNKGDALWKFNPGYWMQRPTIAPDGSIYVVGEDKLAGKAVLYCLNSDGVTQWERQLKLGGDTSVVISDSARIYVVDGDDVAVFDTAGLLIKRIACGGVDSPPIVRDDGSICFVYNGELKSVSEDGTLLWSTKLVKGEPFMIHDRGRPAVAADGTVVIGLGYSHSPGLLDVIRYKATNITPPTPGRLIAVTPDGKISWEYDYPRSLECSPILGPDGTCYAGSWDNELLAVQPQPKR